MGRRPRGEVGSFDLAQPRPIHRRPRRNSSFPSRQMGARARLSAQEESLGVHRQPDRRPVSVRMAYRRRSVVAFVRQRALGVRSGRPDAPPRGEHQRRRHCRGRARFCRRRLARDRDPHEMSPLDGFLIRPTRLFRAWARRADVKPLSTHLSTEFVDFFLQPSSIPGAPRVRADAN